MQSEAQPVHDTVTTEPETFNATDTTRGCPFSWHYEQGFFVKSPDEGHEG